MRVIIVDDEQTALQNLEMTLNAFSEFTEVISFSSPHKAVDWLQTNEVDIAFLDINMNQLNSLALAKRLKELCPSCKVVFVTGYSQYALQAIQMHASGYLMKPARVDDIRAELNYILNPPSAPMVLDKQIRVQCFGNFEVFMGNEPIKFQYSKTKELLAYLIDRRGMTAIAPEKIICDYYSWSRGEIAAINAYAGEYMSQYSWGEFTLGGLESMRNN